MSMQSDQPGEELDEALGGGTPPERPLGVEDYGTTAAEERWDEPLAERIAREEPDVGTPDAELVRVDGEVDDPADELDEAAPAEEAALHVTRDP